MAVHFGKAATTESRPYGNTRRIFVVVRCQQDGCNAEITNQYQEGFNPLGYYKNFKRQGWDVPQDGNKAFCPEHFTVRKSKKLVCQPADQGDQPQQEDPMAALNGVAANTNVTPLPVASAKPNGAAVPEAVRKPLTMGEKIALAGSYLDEHYQPEYGCYKQGASDTEGASQSELPLDRFIRLREEDYGPLKDYDVIRQMVEALQGRFDVLYQLVAAQAELVRVAMQGPADLPEAFKIFLATQRKARSDFLARWKTSFESALAKMEREADALVEDFDKAVKGKLQENHKGISTQISSAMKVVDGAKAELDAVAAELNALRQQLPPQAAARA